MTAQLISDDPEDDGTPDAHPAYWRGHADAATKLLARTPCDAGYDNSAYPTAEAGNFSEKTR